MWQGPGVTWRRTMVAGVCAGALVVAGCGPSVPPAPPQPTVIVYGDSLTSGNRPTIEAALRAQRPGWRVIIRAQGGSALCDWLAQMRSDGNLNARLVVVQMSGNTLTPCMAGIPGGGSPASLAKYAADAQTAASIWLARGVRVLFLASPPPFVSPPPLLSPPHPLDAVYYGVTQAPAGRLASFSDATELALAMPDGGVPKARAVFPFFMPCLPSEMTQPGCVLDPADGVFKIQVRDGAPPTPGEVTARGHFCPVLVSPCPVYSSGAARFANAFAAAAAALMP